MEQMSARHSETVNKLAKEKQELLKTNLQLKDEIAEVKGQNSTLQSELDLAATKLVQAESQLETERLKVK
jgi:predicted  nucleic acid-binding Zn-ribbon protein